MTGVGGIYQEVAVIAESSYTLSGLINIISLPSGAVKFIVNYYDISGRLISGVTLADAKVLNKWTTVKGTLKPPVGAVTARVHVHTDSTSGATYVVDKVTFRKDEMN